MTRGTGFGATSILRDAKYSKTRNEPCRSKIDTDNMIAPYNARAALGRALGPDSSPVIPQKWRRISELRSTNRGY